MKSKNISLDLLYDLLSQLAPHFPKSELRPDLDLFDAGVLDSFSALQFVQKLEDELGIVFDYHDLRRDYIATPAGMLGLLTKKYA